MKLNSNQHLVSWETKKEIYFSGSHGNFLPSSCLARKSSQVHASHGQALPNLTNARPCDQSILVLITAFPLRNWWSALTLMKSQLQEPNSVPVRAYLVFCVFWVYCLWFFFFKRWLSCILLRFNEFASKSETTRFQDTCQMYCLLLKTFSSRF